MHHRRAGGFGPQSADDQAAYNRRTAHRRHRGRNLRDHRPDGILRRDACGGERFPHRQRDLRRAGSRAFNTQAPTGPSCCCWPPSQRLRPALSPRERPERRAGSDTGGTGVPARTGTPLRRAGPGNAPSGGHTEWQAFAPARAGTATSRAGPGSAPSGGHTGRQAFAPARAGTATSRAGPGSAPFGGHTGRQAIAPGPAGTATSRVRPGYGQAGKLRAARL